LFGRGFGRFNPDSNPVNIDLGRGPKFARINYMHLSSHSCLCIQPNRIICWNFKHLQIL
jgi:hypothetical protein